MGAYAADSKVIQFNTDVLDSEDRSKIDLREFDRPGYIMPGMYNLTVHFNNVTLNEQAIQFIVPKNRPQDSIPCLSPKLIDQLGLKEDKKKLIPTRQEGQCLDLGDLPGVKLQGDLGNSSLSISIPQEYLEYSSPNWDPPSRWEDGEPGVLFDYNLNTQTIKKISKNNSTLSGNGVFGANLAAWRLRAEWQLSDQHASSSNNGVLKNLDWNRLYLYRGINNLKAHLIIGENYLNSDLFGSFRFSGVSLSTDESMLPPELRGYAPEVRGVAHSNAKVTISQQGRILYETQVAPGPFRIQNVNNAVSGKLDVQIKEQNGQLQKFQVDTATIPYLTRPGSVRYKLAVGKPSDINHHVSDQSFATGEFSWGVNNGWSIYGGALGGGRYNALSIGIGRDLLVLGAISLDLTRSESRLPQQGNLTGNSYKLSYSKTFSQFDSQLNFAEYRFSQKDYMSLDEYKTLLESGERSESGKEMYTVNLSKEFNKLSMSTFLSYAHNSYWNIPTQDQYSMTVSRYMDVGQVKNIVFSMSVYERRSVQYKDNGMYLSLSFPFGDDGRINYSSSNNKQVVSNNVGYSHQVDANNNYQLQVSRSKRNNLSGFYSHDGDLAQVNISGSHQSGEYNSWGLGLQGGITATPVGIALHRESRQGGTRLMVDTNGVPGVPIRGDGDATHTNVFGKAVVADINSYYRTNANIDLDKLPDNIQASQSTTSVTLTEGAIGYRHFRVISGERAMAVIRLVDGTSPPLGAVVRNKSLQETGIVADGGKVYLSGIHPGDHMAVHWGQDKQCVIELPNAMTNYELQNSLFLPCVVNH